MSHLPVTRAQPESWLHTPGLLQPSCSSPELVSTPVWELRSWHRRGGAGRSPARTMCWVSSPASSAYRKEQRRQSHPRLSCSACHEHVGEAPTPFFFFFFYILSQFEWFNFYGTKTVKMPHSRASITIKCSHTFNCYSSHNYIHTVRLQHL